MQKLHKILLIALIITLTATLDIYSQGAPPPPPSGHGASTNQGAAPIGGGLFILLGLGAAYGGKKFYDYRKEGLEE